MFKDITLPPLLVMKYWVNNDLVDFDVEKICGAVGYYFHLDSRQVHSRGYRHVERCFLQVEVANTSSGSCDSTSDILRVRMWSRCLRTIFPEFSLMRYDRGPSTRSI